jgi:molecular chaperone GrpE
MNDKEATENEIDPGDEASAVPPSGEEQELSGQQLEEIQEKAAKAQQYYDQLLRVMADLDNYKKRAAREKQDAIKFANESLLEKLMPVLDSFEMAAAAANTATTSVQSMQAGITMIFQQLKTALANAGLEEIDASGKPFDPNLHEALSQQESAEAPEGTVLQQVRKGYRLRERLLRPASVIVAKKPAS